MSEDSVSLILSSLALVGVAVVVAIVASLFVPRGRALWCLPRVAPLIVPAAALAAIGAMSASLYYSEVAGFIPCQLCWYQRIAMYPLAGLLVVALVLRDRGIFWYALPLSLVGLAISVRHQIEQQFPSTGGSCRVGVPCSVRDVWEFGFVSIPFMAGTTFAFVAALMLVTVVTQRR